MLVIEHFCCLKQENSENPENTFSEEIWSDLRNLIWRFFFLNLEIQNLQGYGYNFDWRGWGTSEYRFTPNRPSHRSLMSNGEGILTGWIKGIVLQSSQDSFTCGD